MQGILSVCVHTQNGNVDSRLNGGREYSEY